MKRLNKDSHNSSKPPSSDNPGRKPKGLRNPTGKKTGGQKAHSGSTLKIAEKSYEVVPHEPAQCTECGASLEVYEGFRHLPVWDIFRAALNIEQIELGILASQVEWIEADITKVVLSESRFDAWHDRAVFHFLTNAKNWKCYVDRVRRPVKRGGHVIVSTFGKDGPLRCSGLDATRYSPNRLHSEFGTPFEPVRHSERNKRSSTASASRNNLGT